jgi:GNAT acetyltransferase-like protein
MKDSQANMKVGEKADRPSTSDPEKPASPYRVQALDVEELPAWDALVSQSPTGTLFHTTKWLGTTGTPFRIYGCYRENSLIGGIAVELVAPKTAGHSYSITADLQKVDGAAQQQIIGHSYCCPYLGAVLPPPSSKYLTTLTLHRNVLNLLARHLQSEFVSIHSRMGPDIVDMQPFMWAGYSINLRYTYRFDLKDLHVAWRNMTDKRRNDIRKAERDGFTIDDRGSMRDILPLIKGTFQRWRHSVQFGEVADRREQMLRAENKGRCFLARDRSGAAVAGIYIVWDEKCAYYLMGGYGTDAAHRGAGALAIWEAIRYAGSALRLQRFDILCSSIPSIERFIRDFGGVLTPAFIIKYERPSFSRDVQRAFRKLKGIISH